MQDPTARRREARGVHAASGGALALHRSAYLQRHVYTPTSPREACSTLCSFFPSSAREAGAPRTLTGAARGGDPLTSHPDGTVRLSPPLCSWRTPCLGCAHSTERESDFLKVTRPHPQKGSLVFSLSSSGASHRRHPQRPPEVARLSTHPGLKAQGRGPEDVTSRPEVTPPGTAGSGGRWPHSQ